MSDAEGEEVSLDSSGNEGDLSAVAYDLHDFEKRLIEEVKQRPFLFDHTSGGFKDIKKKDAGWVQVAEAVGKTVNKCQCRWKSLRDRYVRESRKIREGNGPKRHMWEMFKFLTFLDDIPRLYRGGGSGGGGGGAGAYLEPNIWAPKRAKGTTKRLPVFVIPTASTQPQQTIQLSISSVSGATSSISTTSNSTAQLIAAPSLVSTVSPSPTPVVPVQLTENQSVLGVSRKSSSIPISNNNHTTITNSNSMLTTFVDMADGCSAFGMSVSATLRTLPVEQQELAKLRIQQVLYEVQFS